MKLSNILIAMADGRLWLLMILVMIGSLIMGMGLPASACYIILAILAAPSLVALGVPTIGAHLFVLYFGAMSAITPPVAMAAFAAAPIAGESAVKIGSWYSIVFVFVNCVLGVAGMSIGIQGYINHKVNIPERILWVVGGILLILPQIALTIAGYVLVVILYISARKRVVTI